MRVLVTGGAGYIGSVVAEELLKAGHQVVVYDNLSQGHRQAVPPGADLVEADLADAAALRACLRRHGIEAVVHLAANLLVSESAANPAKYFRNNVANSLNLIEVMVELGVARLVFSSTAAVYGEPRRPPILEEDPTAPTNPYGESKLAVERMLPWYEAAYGLRYVSLRYFNAAGASDRCGEDHRPETHLIPQVIQAALGRRPYVEIYGTDYNTPDGTGVRDYIHVTDLAAAHVLALEALEGSSGIYNLGNGEGFSVRQVIETARDVTGCPIPTVERPRRPGDTGVLVASAAKIRAQLGWQPRSPDLRAILESAWSWHQRHPSGYEE